MSLTVRLHGRKIDSCWSNGYLLSIRCSNGEEINVKWVDSNGKAIKGTPVIETSGARLKAERISDLIQLPASYGVRR